MKKNNKTKPIDNFNTLFSNFKQDFSRIAINDVINFILDSKFGDERESKNPLMWLISHPKIDKNILATFFLECVSNARKALQRPNEPADLIYTALTNDKNTNKDSVLHYLFRNSDIPLETKKDLYLLLVNTYKANPNIANRQGEIPLKLFIENSEKLKLIIPFPEFLDYTILNKIESNDLLNSKQPTYSRSLIEWLIEAKYSNKKSFKKRVRVNIETLLNEETSLRQIESFIKKMGHEIFHIKMWINSYAHQKKLILWDNVKKWLNASFTYNIDNYGINYIHNYTMNNSTYYIDNYITYNGFLNPQSLELINVTDILEEAEDQYFPIDKNLQQIFVNDRWLLTNALSNLETHCNNLVATYNTVSRIYNRMLNAQMMISLLTEKNNCVSSTSSQETNKTPTTLFFKKKTIPRPPKFLYRPKMSLAGDLISSTILEERDQKTNVELKRF